MLYFIRTYGCQMNFHDSEILAGLLEEAGWTKASRPEEADLVILNTCCVREKAESKVYGLLGSLKSLKDRRPQLIIGVGGCMVQQPGVAQELARRAPHVDLIFGTYNAYRLPELLARVQVEGGPLIAVSTDRGEAENLPVRREGKVKAFITISYGCNNFCSYCIVPYVRGPEISRRPENILREVRELADQGYKEVMFLGQNVNSYGKDLDINFEFADLLAEADKVPGIERIRYTTSHPRDFSDRLINVIRDCRHVCEHFHLPVQAGSNRVLAKMNRGYTREHYLELVEKIKDRVKGASITTDIIVGFPGETEEDFQDTLDLVRRVRFDAAYTFIYSPRRGTPAAEMPDPVDRETKKRWFNELVRLQNKITGEINSQLVGQTFEVLVEGPSKTDPGRLAGRTRTNKIVVLAGEEELAGKLVEVRITAAQTWTLFGEVVR